MLIWRRTGRLGAEERRELDQWLDQAGNRRQAESFEQLWELSGRYKAGYQPDAEAGLKRFQNRIRTDNPQAGRPLRPRWTWRAAAAVLFLALASAALLVRNQQAGHNAGPEQVTTGSGQRREVLLPDGTQVALNENSRLRYLSDWKGSDLREVELAGEAFFEVSVVAGQPFVVHTPEARVRVVGTAFNVRAYPDEPQTEVAVVHGTVVFGSRKGGEVLTLTARQKGILEKTNGLYLESDNAAANARAWQTGVLRFRKTPIWKVARELDRYFHVSIALESDGIRDCQINYGAVRADDIQSAIEGIAATIGAVAEKRTDQSFLIRGGDCR